MIQVVQPHPFFILTAICILLNILAYWYILQQKKQQKKDGLEWYPIALKTLKTRGIADYFTFDVIYTGELILSFFFWQLGLTLFLITFLAQTLFNLRLKKVYFFDYIYLSFFGSLIVSSVTGATLLVLVLDNFMSPEEKIFVSPENSVDFLVHAPETLKWIIAGVMIALVIFNAVYLWWNSRYFFRFKLRVHGNKMTLCSGVFYKKVRAEIDTDRPYKVHIFDTAGSGPWFWTGGSQRFLKYWKVYAFTQNDTTFAVRFSQTGKVVTGSIEQNISFEKTEDFYQLTPLYHWELEGPLKKFARKKRESKN